jgi:hypothetical protein
VIAVRLMCAPLDSPVEGGRCSRERAAAALSHIEGGGRSGALSQSDPPGAQALSFDRVPLEQQCRGLRSQSSQPRSCSALPPPAFYADARISVRCDGVIGRSMQAQGPFAPGVTPTAEASRWSAKGLLILQVLPRNQSGGGSPIYNPLPARASAASVSCGSSSPVISALP